MEEAFGAANADGIRARVAGDVREACVVDAAVDIVVIIPAASTSAALRSVAARVRARWVTGIPDGSTFVVRRSARRQGRCAAHEEEWKNRLRSGHASAHSERRAAIVYAIYRLIEAFFRLRDRFMTRDPHTRP